MDRLKIAAERLTTAMNALDETLVPLGKARDDAKDIRARLAAANEERDRLLARVAELEEESRALADISEEVETRLDGAIAEIRTALGR
jgi:predicted  nucleic acid-binding Zn-ribbon protein